MPLTDNSTHRKQHLLYLSDKSFQSALSRNSNHRHQIVGKVLIVMSASTATVMPTNHLSGDGATGNGVTSLPLTTNMTASSLTSGGNSCLDEQIERLKRCEYLREGEVKALCLRAREILVDESNVQRVDAPVTVCKLKGSV